tara:strand:- start:209 stop:883 length:675 start_codon:yes stop_codon:yes gene_type:complete
MQRFPWNRFTNRIRIRPLTTSPHSSIRKWLKEKKKTQVIDPIKRKKKTTKEKKIHVNNLRTVVSQLFSKVNEVVNYIRNFNSTIVEMIRTEVRIREDEIRRVERKIDYEIYRELDRRIDRNRRYMTANTAADIIYRNEDRARDAELRSRFETHRQTPQVGPPPFLFPLTHFPGAVFEEGGTLDTPIIGKRYKPKTNHNKGVRTKPKPLTKSQRNRLINQILSDG